MMMIKFREKEKFVHNLIWFVSLNHHDIAFNWFSITKNGKISDYDEKRVFDLKEREREREQKIIDDDR